MGSPAAKQTGRVPDRQVTRITSASFAAVILLIIQYVLGIAYNLYGTAPTASKKVGAFSSPLIAVHVILGILLVLAAIYLVVRAIRARIQLAVFTSVLGLLSILTAFFAGDAFAEKGASGFSMAMGVATGVALLCYVTSGRAPGGHQGE